MPEGPRRLPTPELRPSATVVTMTAASMRTALRVQFLAMVVLAGARLCGQELRAPQAPPNIVVIYADDLGFGDISCNGATAVATPHIDRLATEGLNCSDAHSPAATCTPSRYALLTGQYAFRKKGTGVLPGNAAMIIEPGRTTLATILQRGGYRTGVVGKWHLGLGRGELDWNGNIAPGPLEVGFDECLLLPATGDRVPCIYVEGHRVVGIDPQDPIAVAYGERIDARPIGREMRDQLKMAWDFGHDMTVVNGISRIGYMTGGKAALWVDEDMADVFVKRAKQFLVQHQERPFFLFFSTHDIHVPRVPHARFVGKTKMGPRGDAIVQLDWCVGELLAQLDALHLTENTLVIFTSDNGPVVNDGYRDQAEERLGEHKPAGPWRGGKYSAFEAGTRVPFLVRWPGVVKPGTSAALIGQIDFCATLAKLAGQQLAADEAPDSREQSASWLGKDTRGREHLIEQAGSLSLREGTFKFVEASQRGAFDQETKTELGNAPAAQLYDLSKDPGETKNLAEQQPERAAAMAKRLAELSGAGRSR